MAPPKDPYKILGVDKKASQDEEEVVDAEVVDGESDQ
jgi:hypothetical protein